MHTLARCLYLQGLLRRMSIARIATRLVLINEKLLFRSIPSVMILLVVVRTFHMLLILRLPGIAIEINFIALQVALLVSLFVFDVL